MPITAPKGEITLTMVMVITELAGGIRILITRLNLSRIIRPTSGATKIVIHRLSGVQGLTV